jgi:hypothetical protein
MAEGKLNELIRQKRNFLRQAKGDYFSGGNDMLDDVDSALAEAKDELTHRLQVANCVREDEGEVDWRNECNAIFSQWFEKWFGENLTVVP